MPIALTSRPPFALRLTLVLALALLGALARAQVAAAEPAGAALRRTTEGRVVDVLGDPVPAAEIRALRDGAVVARTVADGDGVYRLAAPPGATLQVQAPGKVAATLPWRGAATARVRNVVLEDGARLAGRVLDHRGEGVAHATVVVVAIGVAALTATTDDQGRYTFAGVPLRPLLASATAGRAAASASLRLVGDATHDFALAPPDHELCVVQVRHLPADAPAAHVFVFGPDLAAVQHGGRVPLGADGSARLRLANACLIEVRLPGFAMAPPQTWAGPHTRALDFAVAGPAAAPTRLRGRVLDTGGRPVAAVQVAARDRSRCELGSAFTDATGAFTMKVVLPADGCYRLGLALDEWLLVDDERAIADGWSWIPPRGGRDALELVAERAGRLQGSVRGAAGWTFALGEIVIADSEHAHRRLVGGHVDRGGVFALGLPPGEHELLAVAHEGDVSRAEVRVQAGQVVEPRWVALRTGEIAGELVDAGGRPVPGVELLLASVDLRDPGRARASERQSCRVLTDRHGRFRARGLPEGTWTIAAPTGDAVVGTEVVVQRDRPERVVLTAR